MPAWLIPALMAGASIFGNAAKGSSDQRQSENNQTQQRNQLLAQLYGINQNASQNALASSSAERLAQGNQDLDRRQFALNAPKARASQAVRGSILQNAQPFKVSGLPDRVSSRIPQMEGGLTPGMFNADTRALGGELSRTALIDQLKGDQFDPMTATDFRSGILPQPTLEAPQKAGLLEQILGTLGLASSLAGGVGEAVQGARKRAETNPFDVGAGG